MEDIVNISDEDEEVQKAKEETREENGMYGTECLTRRFTKTSHARKSAKKS